MGRKSLLTSELLAHICKRVEATGDIVGSAVAEGIHVNTVKDWILRGKGEHKTLPKTRLFSAFVAEMADARAVHRNNLLALETKPVFIEKAKTVTLPDGTKVVTTEVIRRSPDPKAIDTALRREHPEQYLEEMPEAGRTTLVSLAEELRRAAVGPYVDPRDRGLPEGEIIDAEALPAPPACQTCEQAADIQPGAKEEWHSFGHPRPAKGKP